MNTHTSTFEEGGNESLYPQVGSISVRWNLPLIFEVRI